jgi:peptide/nickel transport system permease protein
VSKVRSSLLGTLFRSKSAKLGGLILLVFFVLIIAGSVLTPYSPYANTPAVNAPPSLAHPFGTDNVGHDMFSQVVFGAYSSMYVGLVSAIGSAVIGMVVGTIAGYYRRLEGILTGAGDIILTFPAFPLLILLGSMYPPTDNLLILLLILVLWAPIARAVRSQVLSLKERPYVDSARTGGMKDWQIIVRVLMPQVVSIAVAYFVLAVAAAVVLVTSLEFLGVGNPDIVSWGSILYWAQQFAFYLGDWWWVVAPGLSITLVALGFALIGFSIEEVMNPRLRV